MDLVARTALVLLAGCYDPTLKDCTVSCAADTDCAHGQTCAAGGWCAAEGETCTAQMLPIDAPVTKPIDAPPVTPDGPTPNAQLRVTVKNVGSVVVSGVGTCTNASQNQMMTCTYGVFSGTSITATATVTAGGHQFDKWMDPICKSQDASCMFTALPLTAIEADFK